MSKPPQNKTIPCPRCGQKTTLADNPSRPFCSDKCRMIDLGRWADEEYRIPGERSQTVGEGHILPFPDDPSRSGES